MNKIRFSVSGLLLIILYLVSTQSLAQIADISSCRAIEDSQERFLCYERLEALDAPDSELEVVGVNEEQIMEDNPPELRVDAENAPVVEPSQPEVALSTSVPVAVEAESVSNNEDFGMDSSIGNTRIIEEEEVEVLMGTVADLRQILPNTWYITLTNGQQWRQMESKRYYLRIGDEVKISSSHWGGNYRLTATRVSGNIQVRRIR